MVASDRPLYNYVCGFLLRGIICAYEDNILKCSPAPDQHVCDPVLKNVHVGPYTEDQLKDHMNRVLFSVCHLFLKK